jgi:hypothetical protein
MEKDSSGQLFHWKYSTKLLVWLVTEAQKHLLHDNKKKAKITSFGFVTLLARLDTPDTYPRGKDVKRSMPCTLAPTNFEFYGSDDQLGGSVGCLSWVPPPTISKKATGKHDLRVRHAFLLPPSRTGCTCSDQHQVLGSSDQSARCWSLTIRSISYKDTTKENLHRRS